MLFSPLPLRLGLRETNFSCCNCLLLHRFINIAVQKFGSWSCESPCLVWHTLLPCLFRPLLSALSLSLSLHFDHWIRSISNQWTSCFHLSMCIRFSILPPSERCILLAVTYSVLLSSSHSAFFFYFFILSFSLALPSNSRGNRRSVLFPLSLSFSFFLFFLFLSSPTFFHSPLACQMQVTTLGQFMCWTRSCM